MIVDARKKKSRESGKGEAEKCSRRSYSLESIMALQKALEMGVVDTNCETEDSFHIRLVLSNLFIGPELSRR